MILLYRPSVARGGKYSDKGEFGWGGVASTWFSINPTKQAYCLFMSQLIPSTVYPIR